MRARTAIREDAQHSEDGARGGLHTQFLGRVVLRRYQLKNLIAQSSCGLIFRALHLGVGRWVAVKLLPAHIAQRDPKFKKRFLREASLAAQISHPNIVTIHDYGETEQGDLIIVMELLEGRPLSKLLKHEGPLEPVRAVRLAIQIARALKKAHSLGALHRDLKPANVVVRVDADGHELVKVLDFGLVRLFGQAPQVKQPFEAEKLTVDGAIMGTPGYMAPEQIMESKAIDGRADLFGLGAILFQMLTNTPPFTGRNIVEVVSVSMGGASASIHSALLESGAPRGLANLVQSCLERSVDDRPLCADALLRGLLDLKNQLEAEEAKEAAPTMIFEIAGLQQGRPRYRGSAALWALVLCIAAAGLLTVFQALDWDKAPSARAPVSSVAPAEAPAVSQGYKPNPY